MLLNQKIISPFSNLLWNNFKSIKDFLNIELALHYQSCCTVNHRPFDVSLLERTDLFDEKNKCCLTCMYYAYYNQCCGLLFFKNALLPNVLVEVAIAHLDYET